MRTTNRILSALLGIALVVVGLAVAVGMAVIAWGGEPTVIRLDRWYDWLREVRLADREFLGIAAGIALVGLALLVLQLRPWAPAHVRSDAAEGTPLWIVRKAVERRVDAAATAGGAMRAHAKVRGRPGRWRLRVRGVVWPDQRDSVVSAVRAELARLHAPADVAVNLVLRPPPRRMR